METGETLVDQMDRFSVVSRSIISQEAHKVMKTSYSIWHQQHFSTLMTRVQPILHKVVWCGETMTVKTSIKKRYRYQTCQSCITVYILATLRQYCLKYWTRSAGFYQMTDCTVQVRETELATSWLFFP